MNTAYLQETRYGATTIDSVRCVWAIICSLTIASLLLVAVHYKRFVNLRQSLDGGAIATGDLDSLPHNGAVVTLLGICGLTHRQAYKDLFFVAVLFPLFALAVVVTLGSVFGAF